MAQEPIQKKPGLLELLDEWEKQGLNDAEITAQVEYYFDGRAREQGIPLDGRFELTPLCNLNCKMCYVHLSQKQLEKTGRRLLTVDQWKDIMGQAIDIGMRNAVLTGGECLTYPGFDELYLYLLEQGIRVTVKTNGLLMTEERISFFERYRPEGFNVSLYGADDDTYENVTGVRCFQKVYEGIKRIQETKIPLGIAVTPSRFMLNNMDRIMDLLDEFGQEFSINPNLIPPREETGRKLSDVDLTLDDYIAIYKLQAKRTGRELKPVCMDSMPEVGKTDVPAYGIQCGAGRSGFAVCWNGDMQPCLSMSQIKFNLLETSFICAWEKINRTVQMYPIPRECMVCDYRRICPVCVVSHEMAGRQGHANPAWCERARRLIAEGIVEEIKGVVKNEETV